MSKIKNDGLDQYGVEPFEQQQFGTAGIERVKKKKMKLVWEEVMTALPSRWTLQGCRWRGWPSNTGKRDLEKEVWMRGFRYRWRWQLKTELDGVESSVACASPDEQGIG